MSRCLRSALPFPGPWRSAAVGEVGRHCHRFVLSPASWAGSFSPWRSASWGAVSGRVRPGPRGAARSRACARDGRGHARLRSRRLPACRGLAPAPRGLAPRRTASGLPRSVRPHPDREIPAGQLFSLRRPATPRAPARPWARRARSCLARRDGAPARGRGHSLAALARARAGPRPGAAARLAGGGHGRRRRRAASSGADAAQGTLEPSCAPSPRCGGWRHAWQRPDCYTWRSSPPAA